MNGLNIACELYDAHSAKSKSHLNIREVTDDRVSVHLIDKKYWTKRLSKPYFDVILANYEKDFVTFRNPIPKTVKNWKSGENRLQDSNGVGVQNSSNLENT